MWAMCMLCFCKLYDENIIQRYHSISDRNAAACRDKKILPLGNRI